VSAKGLAIPCWFRVPSFAGETEPRQGTQELVAMKQSAQGQLATHLAEAIAPKIELQDSVIVVFRLADRRSVLQKWGIGMIDKGAVGGWTEAG